MTSVNGREEIEANVRLLFQNFFQKISQLDFLKLAASLLPSLRRVIAREEGGGREAHRNDSRGVVVVVVRGRVGQLIEAR